MEVFIGKLEEFGYTNSILMVKCTRGHPFSDIARNIATVMFNLFAKNVVAEVNSSIHKKRSRDVAKKRSPTDMKKRKLNSSS